MLTLCQQWPPSLCVYLSISEDGRVSSGEAVIRLWLGVEGRV